MVTQRQNFAAEIRYRSCYLLPLFTVAFFRRILKATIFLCDDFPSNNKMHSYAIQVVGHWKNTLVQKYISKKARFIKHLLGVKCHRNQHCQSKGHSHKTATFIEELFN